ncbi:MAG: hypothetical protein GX649_00770 [Chloroflexi bacterium]|nr:hypothetical protein [Chloroflexota bacterium]
MTEEAAPNTRDEEAPSGSQDQGQRPKGRTAAEWITLALGAAVLLALVGLIVYQFLSTGNAPASIEVTPLYGEMRTIEGAYYLPVEVHNAGDRAASDVRVEASLEDGERSPVTVPFLDGGETARATLVFSRSPSGGGLQLDVQSYLEP